MDGLVYFLPLLVVVAPFLWLIAAAIFRKPVARSGNVSHTGRNIKLITLAILCGDSILRNRETGDLPTTGVAASDDEIDSERFAKRMLHRMSKGALNVREISPIQRLCQVDGDSRYPVFVVELSSGEADECSFYWNKQYEFTPLDEDIDSQSDHIVQAIRDYRERTLI